MIRILMQWSLSDAVATKIRIHKPLVGRIMCSSWAFRFFCFVNAFLPRNTCGQLYFLLKINTQAVFHSSKMKRAIRFSLPNFYLVRTLSELLFAIRVQFSCLLLVIPPILVIESLKGLPLTQQQLGVNWCRFMCLVYLLFCQPLCSGLCSNRTLKKM